MAVQQITNKKIIKYDTNSPNFKHNIVATAHRSRLSSLQIEERPK